MTHGHSSKDHAITDENHTVQSKDDANQLTSNLGFDGFRPELTYSANNDIEIISKNCLGEKLVIEHIINGQSLEFFDGNRPKLILSCPVETLPDLKTLKMILESYDFDEFQLSFETPECNFENDAECKFTFDPKDNIILPFYFRVLAGEDANASSETPLNTEANVSNNTMASGENNTNSNTNVNSNATEENTSTGNTAPSTGNEMNTTSGSTNTSQNTTSTPPATNHSNTTTNSTKGQTNHTSPNSTNSTKGHANNTTSPSKGQTNETSTSPQKGNATNNTSPIPKDDSNKPLTTEESGSKVSAIDIDSSTSNTLLISGGVFLVIVIVGLACYWRKKKGRSRKQKKGDRQRLVRKAASPTPIKVPELASPNTKSLKFAGPTLLSSEPNTGMSPLNQFIRPGPPHLRLEENGRSSLVPDEIILTNIDNSPKSVTEVSSLASVRDAPKTLDFNIEFSMVEQESIMKIKKGTEGKKKIEF